MTIQQTTQDVLDAIRKSQSLAIDPRVAALGLEKSTFRQPTSATSGLNFYDLEPGAKFLAPVLTPLRNVTPRVSGKGGIQANWRAITGINTTGLRLGVSGGNRAGVQRLRPDSGRAVRSPDSAKERHSGRSRRISSGPRCENRGLKGACLGVWLRCALFVGPLS